MTDGPDPESLAARVATLEQTVAELQQRLAEMPGAQPGRGASARPAPEPIVAHLPVGSPAVVPVPLPSAAAAPDLVAQLSARATSIDLETLIAGRWLNRVGLLAVAIGVAYFLRLAIENEWIGPRGQVALGLVLGSAILASTPWFLKRGYDYFADGLCGLGAAILYLSLWAGGSYYQLFPAAVTFGAMAAVTAGMLVVAMARNSQPVAMMALLGGFITPALVDSPNPNATVLLGYLAVLNAGLLPLAWRRAWRAIDLPAFFLTEGYYWVWFQSADSASSHPLAATFALLFFALFLAIPMLHARTTGRTRFEHRLLVPANAYALLAVLAVLLWPDQRWTLTLAALALSAVHLVAARLVPTRDGRADARYIFAGVALTIATLVIPIRFDGAWTTLAWSVEAAVLVWTGLRLEVRSMRTMALLLFAIAGLRVLIGTQDFYAPAHVVFNMRFMIALGVLASLAVALWAASQHRDRLGNLEGQAFAVLGVAVNILAVVVLTAEVRRYFQASEFQAENALAAALTISLLWALYASGLMVTGLRRSIAPLRWQALALFALTTWKVFAYDMSFLSGLYRVASSMALGLVLLIVSFVYQRSLRNSRPGTSV